MKKKNLTPAQTVRAQCTDCLVLKSYNKIEIENCKGDTCYAGACPFFDYRLGKRMPIKIFRQFCNHCMGGNKSFVKDCPSTSCKVYPYRFGKRPLNTIQE